MTELAEIEGMLYPRHVRQISEWLHRDVALADDSLGKCVEIALSRLYTREPTKKVELQRGTGGRFLPRPALPRGEDEQIFEKSISSEKSVQPSTLPRDKLGHFTPRSGQPRPSVPHGEVLLERIPIDLDEDADVEIDHLVHKLVDRAQQDADALGLRVQYYVLRATFALDQHFHPRKIFKLSTSSSEDPTNQEK